MSFTYEDRQINSPYVDKIWHTLTTSDGIYTAGLDGNWDIIISRMPDSIYVTVNGVGKGAVEVPYVAGIDSVGIALKPGVYLRDLKGKDIVDSQHVLTKDSGDYVRIGGKLFEIPDFNSAEAFIEQLAGSGVLLINDVVSSLDGDSSYSASDRSIRRHVSQTTGLSPYFFHQIQRAQRAAQLLQQGMPISQVALEVGYTDQAHMTKALKSLLGRTPTQIIRART